MEQKKLGKRMIERVITGVPDKLNTLHVRAWSHVPTDSVSEAALCEAMVPGEDLPVVRRSTELFGYMRNYYYGNTHTTIIDFPDAHYPVRVALGRRSSWLMPAYLSGKEISYKQLPESFVPLLQPIVAALDPLQQAYQTALEGWRMLRDLCNDDLSRMYYLWPVLATLYNTDGVDLGMLPKPRGVPGVSPDLRERLTEATAFINTVMMMPPVAQVSPERLTITVGN